MNVLKSYVFRKKIRIRTRGSFLWSGSGLAVVVVRAVELLIPVRSDPMFGLHCWSGELDMADQVKYMMYIVMQEAWNRSKANV